LVVLLRGHDGFSGREQLETHEKRKEAAQSEAHKHRDQVHDPDALVIEGGQPRGDTRCLVQVVFAASLRDMPYFVGCSHFRHDRASYSYCTVLMYAMSASISVSLSKPL
jgi:hypothetical protein